MGAEQRECGKEIIERERERQRKRERERERDRVVKVEKT